MRVRVGAVVDRGGLVVGAEVGAAAGAAGVGLGGEVLAVVAQDGQQLPARREAVSDGDAGVLKVAAQPLVLGAGGAFLAEQLGLVFQRAGPSRRPG